MNENSMKILIKNLYYFFIKKYHPPAVPGSVGGVAAGPHGSQQARELCAQLAVRGSSRQPGV